MEELATLGADIRDEFRDEPREELSVLRELLFLALFSLRLGLRWAMGDEQSSLESLTGSSVAI
jgi:hypothetical protein